MQPTSILARDSIQLRPVVLVQKGCLSSHAKTALRKAGYSVVEAADTAQVKQFYPDTFNSASDKAKIDSFNFILASNGYSWSRTEVMSYYIHYLKQQKAF